MTVIRSIVNFRDLGGLTGAGGRRIAPGRLFRSANPGLADDDDLDTLAALGLDEILDLRAPDEKSSDRSLGDRFRWTAIPIVAGNITQEIADQPEEDADTRLLRVYRRLPLDFAPQYREMLARAEQGRTFLLHCAAGKDRTGVGILLLLSALGVPQDQIVADFLRSNDARDALLRQFMPKLREQGLDPAAVLKLLEVEEIYLRTAIEKIELEHGSIERYLTDVLDVDVERIRRNYLED